MNTKMISAAVVMSVVAMFGSGCSAPAAQPARTAQAQIGQQSDQTQLSESPAKWRTIVIADGVEIRVSEDAGPDATMVVEQIQREMRARYISARQ